MSEISRRPYEADPLAVIDHQFIAEAVLIRLNRGKGPLDNLDGKLFDELSRPGSIDDFIAMLSTLMSNGYGEDGELVERAAKTNYVMGASLALEVLDAIAFDRRIPLGEYRAMMIGPNDTVTSPLTIDADDNNPERLMFYVGNAILRQGEDAFEGVEVPYQALCGAVIAAEADVLTVPQAFVSGFGMVYSYGKKAHVELVEEQYDTEMRAIAGPPSSFDKQLEELLNSSL